MSCGTGTTESFAWWVRIAPPSGRSEGRGDCNGSVTVGHLVIARGAARTVDGPELFVDGPALALQEVTGAQAQAVAAARDERGVVLEPAAVVQAADAPPHGRVEDELVDTDVDQLSDPEVHVRMLDGPDDVHDGVAEDPFGHVTDHGVVTEQQGDLTLPQGHAGVEDVDGQLGDVRRDRVEQFLRVP